MCLHVLKFYLMLLIFDCVLLLHLLVLRFLYIPLHFSNIFAYASVMMICIMLLPYIIMLLLLWLLSTKILCFYYEEFWIIITVWIFLGRFQVWWTERVPTVPMCHIVIKRTLQILCPRLTFLCMLSYFNVVGIQRVFIVSLVIFSPPFLIQWDVERLFPTGSSSNQMRSMGEYLWPLTI